MSFFDYGANALLNSLFGKTSNFGALATAPSIYLAALTTLPTPNLTGSTITEANYTGYARVNVVAASWAAASGRAVTNSVQVNFGQCTAGSSTINAIAVVDASSTGNAILYSPLLIPQTISTGNLTLSGTTATCTITAHGYSAGDSILITGCEQPEYDGWKVLATTAANTFTFVVGNAPASPATVTTGNAMQAWKATTLSVTVNVQPQFAIGNLVIPFN